MPITAGPWIPFNEVKRQFGLKTISLTADTIKMALMPSGWTPNIDTQNAWPDISASQISGNGYVAGGVALASKTWTRDDATDKSVFGAATVSFGPASGGPITARRAVLYDDTTATKYLLAHCLLDAGNVDVSAPEGVSLEVGLSAGILELG